MKKLFLIIFLIFGGVVFSAHQCNGIKVLENTTKEIVNRGGGGGSSNSNTKVGTNLHRNGSEKNHIKSIGNGIMSTGPVIYPDDDNTEMVTTEYDKTNQRLNHDSKVQQPSTNEIVWVANNNSNSGQNKQTSSSSGVTITSPEVIQIVGKDSRGSKNIKDFVPSPELKMPPLTEEILHQNYMNDHTRLQIQTPQLQQNLVEKSNTPTESFQPSGAINRDKYGITNGISSSTSTIFNGNNNNNEQQQQQQQQQQPKSYQIQYQIQQSRPDSIQLNKSNYQQSQEFNQQQQQQQQQQKQHDNDFPIYQKSGSTKKYYPSKIESNENNAGDNDSGSEISTSDNYQPSSNQYIRNEVSWPLKDKDYIRVQPQTVQEYIGGGGGGGGSGSNSGNIDVNWNNNHHNINHHSHPEQHYEIHEDELLNNEEKHNQHHHHHDHEDELLNNEEKHNQQHHHSKQNHIIFGPQNNGYHYQHPHYSHQQSYSINENIPNGLSQYKYNSLPPDHPYKFESVSNQNLKWEENNHHNHNHHQQHKNPSILNFGGGGGGGHPLHLALNQHNIGPILHIPKHYESETFTSNEDGTINVKGSNYDGIGHQHYENGEHNIENGGGGYHYSGLEHGGGKHSKYLYFKKIASIIAGIIPIGLLISALTPNYVVINPNATTLNSPVAPFTLVQGTVNRQRSLKSNEQQPQQQQQQQHLEKGAGIKNISNILNEPQSTIQTMMTIYEKQLIKNENLLKKNFLKLHKKFPSSSIATMIKNSKCIERSICELAAGNKNPQLLKSLLEELQRNYRNEIENHSRTLTSDTISVLDSIESISSTSASKSTEEEEEEELQTSSSSSTSSASTFNNKQYSFVSEDDLLKASKGVNCSSYICEELISK